MWCKKLNMYFWILFSVFSIFTLAFAVPTDLPYAGPSTDISWVADIQETISINETHFAPGTPVTFEAPYMVYLYFYKKLSITVYRNCAGTLINKNYIMTAAHCAVDATNVQVVFCAKNPRLLESQQIRLPAVNIIIHKNFNRANYGNDIALIEMGIDVIAFIQFFSPNCHISAVNLPSLCDANTSYDCQDLTILGWGFVDTANDPDGRADSLQSMSNKVLPQDQCCSKIGSSDTASICMCGQEQRGVLIADAGGPGLVNNIQVGIISACIRNCPSGEPTILTQVNAYLSWIEKQTNITLDEY